MNNIKKTLISLAAIVLAGGAAYTQQSAKINNEPVQQQVELVEVVDNGEEYHFKNEELLAEHYEKHGIDMGFTSANEYETAASKVINNSKALHKLEAEDGDDVYYLEDTNEFVIVSTRGYIRTYFCPDSGRKYFDKQ